MLLALVLTAAVWVDATTAPRCLDAARLQAALEKKVGARTHGERVTLTPTTTGEIRVALSRGEALVATRDLPLDEASCPATERSITLLVAYWWKLPSPAPPPATKPLAPSPVPKPAPEDTAAVPIPVPEQEPVPELAQPTPTPEPSPAPIVRVEPVVTAPPPPAEPLTLSAWRWHLAATGAVSFNGPAGFSGQVTAAVGRRDGLAATLDAGLENQRVATDAIGAISVNPFFATVGAEYEHRFSRLTLSGGLGVRLYLLASRSHGYLNDGSTLAPSPAVVANAGLRFPLTRHVFIALAGTLGTRFQEERFIVTGSTAAVAMSPWFGQLSAGVGVGSE